MFKTVGKLLHAKPVTNGIQIPSHSPMIDLAEKFMPFFDAKVNAIHQELMLKYDDNTFIISLMTVTLSVILKLLNLSLWVHY